MSKFGKYRKTISIILLVCMLILATGITPVFAKVTGYVTEKDGVKYEYNQEDLIDSIIEEGPAYQRYLTETLIAIKDNVNGYIDVDDVINAIVANSLEGKILDVDVYTESEDAKVVEITEVKHVDKEGNVEEKKEFAVISISAIEDIVVEFGGELNLPATVTATLNDEEATEVTLDIVWADNEEFDAEVAGEYEFEYTLKIQEDEVIDFELPEDKAIGSITVTVQEVIGLEVVSVSAITKTTAKVTFAEDTVLTDVAEDYAKLAITVDGGTATNPTKIAKIDNKNYTITFASLDKTQGILKVNGTAADLIGKGTANQSVYNFDFKAPTLVSANALNARQVELTFSEAIKSTTATLTNFELKDLVGGTNVVTNATIQSDKTKVLLTVNDPMVAGANNYVLNLKADAVKDMADNANAAYQLAFSGSSEADAIKPALKSASYEKATGKITVFFNKPVAATLDSTKISVNDVALAAADGAVQDTNDKTKFVIGLTATKKAEVDALTGDLTLKIAADAIADAANANLKNAETTVALAVVAAPEFVEEGSQYDENTGVLTLKFTVPVKVANITKIKVNGDNALVAYDKSAKTGDEIVNENVFSDTININLSVATADKVQTVAAGAKMPIKVEIGAVKNASDTTNSVEYSKSITFVQDTTKPVLQSAEYANAGQKLTLTFSEPVRQGQIAANNLFVVVGDTETKITKAAKVVAQDNPGNTLAVEIDNADKALFEDAYAANKAIKVRLVANAVYDYAGVTGNTSTQNGNALIVKANAINVAYADTGVPNTGTVTVISNKQVKVEFSTRMDKASAETKANYELKDIYGAAVEIDSVSLDAASEKAVYIVTKTAMTQVSQPAGSAYTLKISNLKSVAGIPMAVKTVNFDGKAKEADTSAPTIADNAVVFTVLSGKENDTIEVTFTDANDIDKASAENLANYTLTDLGTDGKGTTALTLNADTVKSIALAGTKVTITLKTINLQDANKYSLKVAGVKDVLGNAIAAAGITKTTDGATPTAFFAKDGIAPTVTGAMASSTATQTTVYVTFSEDVDLESARTAANYRIAAANAQVGAQTYMPTSVSYDVATKKATLVVDQKTEGTAFDLFAKGVKDLAGNAIAGFDTTIGNDNKIAAANPATDNFVKKLGILGDLIPPAFAVTTPIVAETKAPAADNTDKTKANLITLKFTEEVDKTTAEDERNYIVSINGTALKATADKAVGTTQGSELSNLDANTQFLAVKDAADTVKLYTNVALLKGDTVSVTAKGILDLAGNAMAEATVSATATAADPTPETGATVAITDARTVAVTFANDILASSVQASDFEVVGNIVNVAKVDSSTANQVNLTLAAPILGGDTVTVKASATFEIKDTLGNVLSKDAIWGADNAGKTSVALAKAFTATFDDATDSITITTNYALDLGTASDVSLGGTSAVTVGNLKITPTANYVVGTSPFDNVASLKASIINGKVVIAGTSKASGGAKTATFTDTVGTLTDGETVIYSLGGKTLTLTAKTSGATGGQFNIGADANATATNIRAALTAAIAANNDIKGKYTVSGANAEVTVTAVVTSPVGKTATENTVAKTTGAAVTNSTYTAGDVTQGVGVGTEIAKAANGNIELKIEDASDSTLNKKVDANVSDVNADGILEINAKQS